MKMSKTSAKYRWHVCRPLVVTALMVGGLIQLAIPVLADGTAAGTAISNTATATYEDPAAPGVSINATSNSVTVTVAEVAGITVVADSVRNNTAPGGQILPGHELFYDYQVTNVGNGETSFFIPDSGNISITGAGTFGTTGVTQVQVSYDGGLTFENLSLTGAVPGAQLTDPVLPGGSVIVRVPITVNANAPSGAAISVVLGNTGANDNSAGTQNQSDATDGANINEVRTVDSNNTTAPVAPGEKEASARQQILVGAQPQAFAAVLKSRTNYVPNNPTDLTDDVFTYGLSLRVDGSAPAGSPGLVAAPLIGQTLSGGVAGDTTSRFVLVSDAIPTGTQLVGGTGSPTTPNANWTVVYTASPLSTTADQAVWVTTAPATPTRIGYVFNTTANGPIATSSTVTGFSFQVVTTNVPATGQNIENIAQVFGATQGAPTRLVYDESGDQNPSNFNDDGTPGPTTPTNGVANSATQGTDPNSGDNNPANDNQGIGPGGEVNVFVLLPPGAVLNGPDGQPGAVGPTDTNDDFTNQAVSGTDTPARGNTLTAPVTVTFTNTVENPGTSPITDVLLVPRDISQVAGIANADLPNGTIVQVVYGTTNATYSYNSTTGTFVFTGGTGPGPVRINNLPAGTSADYTVNVTLPTGTPLSTDETTPGSGVLNGSYPVPVVAFSDTGTVNGVPDVGESQNLTINRTYLGYLRLAKDVRVLNSAGTQVEGFTTAPSAAVSIPGNILEYRVTYQNISEDSAGSGNVILNANNVVITENGTVGGVGGNNWALDNDNSDGDGNNTTGIDTSNVQGTASAAQGTITFNPGGDRSGPSHATDVTIYINNTGVVGPQTTGEFRFRRRIN